MMKKLFNNLKDLRTTSFAYAVRPFLISKLGPYSNDFWVEWMSDNDKCLEMVYYSNWANPLILYNQSVPEYTENILKRIQNYLYTKKQLTCSFFLNKSLNKIRLNSSGNVVVWKDNQWVSVKNVIKFIKKDIEAELYKYEYLEKEYSSLRLYLCEDKKTIREEQFSFNFLNFVKKINFSIPLLIDPVIKKINTKRIQHVDFNNQITGLIGVKGGLVFNTSTLEYCKNKKYYYFSSYIEKREIKNVNAYCYPICDWYSPIICKSIKKLLQQILYGHNNNQYYFCHNNKTGLFTILKTLFGDYYFETDKLSLNKTNLPSIEKEIKEKRIVVVHQPNSFSSFCIEKLIKEHPNVNFIINMLSQDTNFDSLSNCVNIDSDICETFDDSLIDYDYIFSWIVKDANKDAKTTDKKTCLNFMSKMLEDSFSTKDKIKFKKLYYIYKTYTKNTNMIKENNFYEILKQNYSFKRYGNCFYFINIRFKNQITI